MGVDAELFENSEFRKLLSQRSRWRWGLSGFLIVAYIVYGIGGVYFADAYAMQIFGTSIPAGVAVGSVIILLSIVLSLYYVRVVNRIEDEISRQVGARP